MSQSRPERFRSWRQFFNAFRLAMDSIRAHKLRSFLTLLGVIIGVASVIMVGAGAGRPSMPSGARPGFWLGIISLAAHRCARTALESEA
jgi:hypothetical protein